MEENKRIRKAKGSITISTTISPELWEKCQKVGVSWAEALRIGVTFILNQVNKEEYANPLQYERKIEALASRLGEFAKQNEELQTQLSTIKKETKRK